MRIIIRYCNQWGNLSTKAINVNPSSTIQQLKQTISDLTDISEDEQIVMINQQIMEDELTLESYNPEQGQFIYVTLKNDQSNQEIQELKPFAQQRYFQKLGIIMEDTFEDNEKEEEKSMQRKPYSAYLEDLIKYVNANEWMIASEIIEQCQQSYESKPIVDLINDRTYKGWNAFHYACHGGMLPIMIELVGMGADINLTTQDEWSPLMLTIQKQHHQCSAYLLKQSQLNINYKRKGTQSLNMVVQKGELDLVEMMIKHPMFYKSEVDMHSLKGDSLAIDLVKKYCQVANMVKPKGQKGYCKKVNVMRFFHYKRYFVLDPDAGTLSRYKEEKAYPLNPVEVIALSNVQSVEIPRREWYMKGNHHYLNILHSQNQILSICSKKKYAIDEWKKALIESVDYFKMQESKLMQFSNLGQLDQISSAMNSLIQDPQQYYTILDSRMGSLQDQGIQNLLCQSPIKQPMSSSPTAQLAQQLSQPEQNTQAYLTNYQVIKQIGQGSFGKVFLVKLHETQQIYAMKQLNKRKLLSKKQIKYAVAECNILKLVDCPNIINLYQAFQTPLNLYLVMDYCSGGDLAYHLSKYKKFTENATKIIINQLIIAIEHLHGLDIIYRDLKPENILLDKSGLIKLVDFGLSKQVEQGRAKSFCGSPAYLAPEVLNLKGAIQATDIYGIGAVMYELLTGNPPYFDEDIEVLYHNIRTKQLPIPGGLSKPCQQLLQGLLQKDPHKRLGCRVPNCINWNHIKQHEWLKYSNQDKLPIVNESNEESLIFSSTYTHKLYDEDYKENNLNLNRIINWSFTRNK